MRTNIKSRRAVKERKYLTLGQAYTPQNWEISKTARLELPTRECRRQRTPRSRMDNGKTDDAWKD